MKNLLIISSLLISTNAFSWGKTGHRVVGEIAEQNLDKSVLKKIKELSGTESLWRASTWADEVRSDPSFGYSSPWHYVSIPNQKTYFDQKRSKDGDVIEALFRLEDVLRDTKKTKEERLNALRFIVHFVGDLHQPLHVGLAEDRGGNLIKVKWFKTESNLHTVWDESIIDFEQLSYTEYAKYLNQYTKEEKAEMVKGNYLDWSKESQDLRPKVYEIPETNQLSYEYGFKVKPIIEKRLKEAGIRLASVLTKIFNQEKLKKDDLDIRNKIINNI